MRLFALLWILLFACTPAHSLEFLEREVIFSEAEIQAALLKAGPLQKNYGGFVNVSLKEAPTISLQATDGRAGIAGSMDIQLLGSVPIRVDITGRAGIRYDDRSKAFFLENPVVDSVKSVALRQDAEATARQAVTQLVIAYFRSKPVYVLRDNAGSEEASMRWLLKSVRIEPGRVVAVLSPL